MAEPMHEAVRVVRRQLRRVRWRQNGYELQRAAYLVVAAVAAAAAAVVALALATDVRTFAVGVAAVSLLALGAAIAGIAAAARRWVSPRRAPAWVDARAALGGRLATLVELAGRDAGERAFLPLLAERTAAGLDAWRPEVVVPDTFPRGALGAAVAACSALTAVVVLAPALAPPHVLSSLAATADRAPIDARLRLRADDAAAAAPGAVQDGDDDALASVASALRRRIRHDVGGPRWDEMPAAVASSEAGPGAETSAASSDAPEPSWDIAPDRLARARATSPDADADAASPSRGADASGRGDGRIGAPDAAGAPSPAGAPAAGAGTGTDPNLLGAASDGTPGAATFTLPIAARVRATGGGRRPGSGETPPADPDARPALGDGQRRDAPILRADVAPAWEPAVRRLFAHAEAP